MGQKWCTASTSARAEAADSTADAVDSAVQNESSSVPDAKRDQIQLCVLVHGIEGSSQDMQIWKERLELHQPEWHLLAASSISRTCKVVGDGIDKLGELLTTEVMDKLKELGTFVQLHFICHSLGGLIARAAMPSIMANAQAMNLDVTYGHFVSLNSPHLGIRSGHPFTCWKNMGDIVPGRLNLIRLIHQVTLQDRGSKVQDGSQDRGRPFLEELADASGKHCRALAAFRHRTAVAASHWDVMVPCCTAAICSKNTFPSPSIFTGHLWPFWRLDAALGFAESLPLGAAGAATTEAAARFQRSIDEVQASLPRQESSSSTSGSERSKSERWRKSNDAEVEFRPNMLQGLSSLYWRRVAYTVHFPFADVHLFTIGKDRKLRSWSIEFIDLMIRSIFLDG